MATTATAPAHPGIYSTRTEWWNHIEAQRTPNGPPAYAFDFISLHHHDGEGFNLLAPMCMVHPQTFTRPRFESKRFPTKKAAADYAKRVCRAVKGRSGLKIVVVECLQNS